jgi:hypothetical protein
VRANGWLIVLALGVVAAPAEAASRTRIAWAEVVVREGSDARRVAKSLSAMLKKSARHVDWGKKKEAVRVAARITRFDWQELDDVLRLEITAVGRVEGGSEVRSRVRVGGRPTERAKLEREGLRIVAEGLVTRLAEVVRRK